MKVVLLGRLAELAGWREREVGGAATLADLVTQLTVGEPQLGEALRSSSVKAVVDHVLVHRDTHLRDAREVAFMPPLSGG